MLTQLFVRSSAESISTMAKRAFCVRHCVSQKCFFWILSEGISLLAFLAPMLDS